MLQEGIDCVSDCPGSLVSEQPHVAFLLDRYGRRRAACGGQRVYRGPAHGRQGLCGSCWCRATPFNRVETSARVAILKHLREAEKDINKAFLVTGRKNTGLYP